jgi:hypothetical protein
VDEGHRRERHARGPQGALGALNLITRLVEPFGGPGLSLLDGGLGVDEIVSGMNPGPVQGGGPAECFAESETGTSTTG